MMKIRVLAAGAALVIAAAGCSTAGHPTAVVTRTVTTHPVTASPVSKPASSPTHTARMSRSQAARAYLRIIDPANRDNDAVVTDTSDKPPFSQFVADARAYVRDTIQAEHQLLADRWPTGVEPYVRAMATTDMPADVTCYRRMAAAGSYGQANNVSFSNVCQADTGANATQIRQALHLPPLNG